MQQNYPMTEKTAKRFIQPGGALPRSFKGGQQLATMQQPLAAGVRVGGAYAMTGAGPAEGPTSNT